MSGPTICGATGSATSSPAWAAGRALCGLPDGTTTERSGPAPAPASLSARQAEAAGLLTSGTCGLRGTGSSRSAALQSSLESRLQRRLSSRGSTLYTLTWKPWATASGPSRFRLRASAPRTSETGCGGWPTPTSSLAHKGVRSEEGAIREVMRSKEPDLAALSQMAGWPTTAARDWKGATRDRWGTNARPLNEVATLAGPARFTVSGLLLTGSSAEMASGGQLNPEHIRWLMGYPPEWGSCAPMAMPSSRRSRQSSSPRGSRKKPPISGAPAPACCRTLSEMAGDLL